MSFSAESFSRFLRTLPRSVEKDPFSAELEVAADDHRKIQAENFARQADAKGITWAPRRVSASHPLLRKTLKMFHSATVRRAPGSIQVISARKLKLGISESEVPYAKKHQRGEKGLPRRQFYYVNKASRGRLRAPAVAGMRRVLRVQQKRFQKNG